MLHTTRSKGAKRRFAADGVGRAQRLTANAVASLSTRALMNSRSSASSSLCPFFFIFLITSDIRNGGRS